MQLNDGSARRMYQVDHVPHFSGLEASDFIHSQTLILRLSCRGGFGVLPSPESKTVVVVVTIPLLLHWYSPEAYVFSFWNPHRAGGNPEIRTCVPKIAEWVI